MYLQEDEKLKREWLGEERVNSAISCHIDKAWSGGREGGEEGGGAWGRNQLLKLFPSPTHQKALLCHDSLYEECELPRQPFFQGLCLLAGDSRNT